MLRAAPLKFGEWTAWSNSLSDKLKSSESIQKLIDSAEKTGENSLPTVLREVKTATGHLKGLNIAVMGCVVNGLGEMADADYGYVGKGEGLISLYRGRELVKNMVPADRGVEELIALIRTDGRWEDPQ